MTARFYVLRAKPWNAGLARSGCDDFVDLGGRRPEAGGNSLQHRGAHLAQAEGFNFCPGLGLAKPIRKGYAHGQ
jgi:hypothetical protein